VTDDNPVRRNLCGVCPYRQAIQARADKLEKALIAIVAEYLTRFEPGSDVTTLPIRMREIARVALAGVPAEPAEEKPDSRCRSTKLIYGQQRQCEWQAGHDRPDNILQPLHKWGVHIWETASSVSAEPATEDAYPSATAQPAPFIGPIFDADDIAEIGLETCLRTHERLASSVSVGGQAPAGTWQPLAERGGDRGT
jgi:hypothetical protein